MSTFASGPGRALSRAAWRVQTEVEAGIVRARAQLGAATAGPTPLDSFVRTAGHAELGLVHGVIGIATGTVNLVGGTEQALTDPALDLKVLAKALPALAHPLRALEHVGSAVREAFRKDAPYSAGDFASLGLPIVAGLATGGLVGGAVGLAAGSLAAAVSPQPPAAIDAPNPSLSEGRTPS